MVHVGKSYPIHDALGKATGRTVYAGDMELKGMLHMAVLFSKIPHGFVKKLDYSKAMELPGVVDAPTTATPARRSATVITPSTARI